VAFISYTRLRLRRWYYVPAFLVQAGRSMRQARRAPGYITGALSADLRRTTFWTVTVWSDEAAMRAYRSSGAHRTVMPRLAQWCDEAAVANHAAADETLPTGEAALKHMQQHGRVSRVRYPTPTHAAGETVPDGRPPRFAAAVGRVRSGKAV
jgi:quinol monooxygenase YgiN